MKIAYQLNDIAYDKNSIVTVGSFDGVHLAHHEVIREVVGKARDRNGRAVVVTFDPHPKEVLSGKPMAVLTTVDEKQRLCEQLGVDLFVLIKFTYEFSRQSSRDFYLNYIIHGIGVSEVVEGYDHHFGRDREGSVEDLLKLGKEFGFSVVAMKPVQVGEEVVSSSKIRQHLLDGNVDRAERLLGSPYSISGTVVHGDGRGQALGYPTANIRLLSNRKLIPRNGIYFVHVLVGGTMFYGMLSIGVRPTFNTGGERTIEVNLLDFEGNLYGQTIEIFFLQRLRDELKFDSAAQLIEQMHRDKEESLKLRDMYSNNFNKTLLRK